MAADIGQGSYIAFDTILGGPTTNTAQYRVNSISLSGMSRDVVDASHMLTSGGKEFVASSIYDPGELSVEVQFDPSIRPWTAITNASVQQSVSMYFANGGTATLMWSAYGYMSGFEASVPKDDMMTGTVTIKLQGSLS